MKSSEITRVLFVGEPGAGKTTVLEALKRLGCGVADDSARVIIRERKAAGLSPRPNPDEFAQQILQRDIAADEHAVRLHDRTRDWYRDIGYTVVEAPQLTAAERAQFVLSMCYAASASIKSK